MPVELKYIKNIIFFPFCGVSKALFKYTRIFFTVDTGDSKENLWIIAFISIKKFKVKLRTWNEQKKKRLVLEGITSFTFIWYNANRCRE